MARFCANCGTEVDETAVFCPTCGQPIDQDVETQMPAAPAWPDPEPEPVSDAASPTAGTDRWAAPASSAEPSRSIAPGLRPDPESAVTAPAAADPVPRAVEPSPPPAPRPAFEEPTRVEDRPPLRSDTGTPPAAAPGRDVPPAAAPASATRGPAGPSVDLPVTMPVTLSGWLIGGGAAVAAIGAVISVFDGFGAALDLVALVALALVALSVFFSATIPTIPHLRLVTFAVVLVVFGIAVDRLGFGGAGAGELLLFLGSAAAVIGAFLLELGRDQPLGGPQP